MKSIFYNLIELEIRPLCARRLMLKLKRYYRTCNMRKKYTFVLPRKLSYKMTTNFLSNFRMFYTSGKLLCAPQEDQAKKYRILDRCDTHCYYFPSKLRRLIISAMYKRGQQLLGASIFLQLLIKLNRRLQQNISSVQVLFNITFRSFPNVFISLVAKSLM